MRNDQFRWLIVVICINLGAINAKLATSDFGALMGIAGCICLMLVTVIAFWGEEKK